MHSAVLQNKKYIKFAAKNSVEVMVLSGIEAAVQKQARKAATYKSKDAAGHEVEYLVEFPGLSVADLSAMNRSKASSYNDTGSIPHTAFVDPFTLEKIQGIRGGVSSGAVMDAALAAQKLIRKKHGKASFSRKDLAKLAGKELGIIKQVARHKLGRALAEVAKLEKDVAKLEKMGKTWPQEALARIQALKTQVLEAVSLRLDSLEKLGTSSPKQAKNKLMGLYGKLEGSPLAARARALLDKLSSRIGSH